MDRSSRRSRSRERNHREDHRDKDKNTSRRSRSRDKERDRERRRRSYSPPDQRAQRSTSRSRIKEGERDHTHERRRREHSGSRSRSRSPDKEGKKRRSHRSRSRSRDAVKRRRSSSSHSRSRSRSLSDSESGSERDARHKKRSKKESKKRRSSASRERRKEKRERKKEKKEKKKLKKYGVSSSSSHWGKYGVITETDLYNKGSEFSAWLIEECKINPETVTKDQERKHFAKFVEDYNTATLPHEKYYDMTSYSTRMAALRSGEYLPPPSELDAYDPNADMRALQGAHKKKSDTSERESYMNREQLMELRKVMNERTEVGRMKVLGMDIKQNFGVRMDGNTFE